MDALLDILLVAVFAINILVLGTSRIMAVIRLVALQGVVLGGIALAVREHHDAGGVLAVGAVVALKGILIPVMLARALREAQIKREVEPFIGLMPSMLLGALATAFATLFARLLPLTGGDAAAFMVAASIATVLAGFIMLVSRYKAISQVIGYLMLENGVFLFGMLLVDAMPLIVELGALLDLFVGIFVICIIVGHISRAFDSQDTRRLVVLKE